MRIAAALLLSFVFVTVVSGQEISSPHKLMKLIQQSPADSNRANLMLDLCLFYIRKPDENPSDLDSAILIAGQTEAISNRIGYAKGLGDSYRYRFYAFNEKGNKEAAKELIQKAIPIYTRMASFTELGECYHALGTCYAVDNEAELNTRIELEQKALTAYRRSGNTLNQAGSCRQLGELYQIAYDLPNSIRYLKQSLLLYQENRYQKLHGVYDLVAQHYRLVGDFEEAIKYGLLAVRTAEATGDTTLQMSTIYNRLALSCYAYNDFTSGKFYFLKALVIARKFRDHASISIIAPNAAMAMNRLNEPEGAIRLLQEVAKSDPPQGINEAVVFDCMFATTYLAMNRHDMAGPFVQRLIDLENRKGISGETYRRMYTVIIEYFISGENYNEAGAHLRKLERRPDLEVTHRLSCAYWNFKIDSAAGMYESAIRHYQDFKSLNDASFNESRTRQIEQLKIEFETDKKDQEIRLKEKDIRLLKNEKQLQQTMLNRARYTKNLVLIGAIVLLVLVALLYSRYQVKKWSNIRLEKKQREINGQNETLRKLVKEKEWLLKEVHHRVKNNLQIVMSLLNSQSAYLADTASVAAIRDSRNRVNSIALIHQKLYQSENIAIIDMPQYIQDLVDYLEEACSTGSRIRFEVSSDPVQLDVTKAVPLGLILNEAITNAIKYAFPGREGVVRISLRKMPHGQSVLIIADNGVGMPGEFPGPGTGSLGMSLMRGLTEEIDGRISIEAGNGVAVKITF